jgi:hypothetical protein
MLAQDAAPRPGSLAPDSDPTGTHGDIILDDAGAAPLSDVGVLLKPKANWPTAAAKLGSSDANSAFKVFNSSNAQLFSVLGNGNVGIGSVPGDATLLVKGARPLAVNGATSNGAGLLILDLPEWGVAPGGVAVLLTGNSVFRAGSVQLGYANSGVINSTDNLSLQLNAWVNNDVVVGLPNGPNALKVVSTGLSFFAGNVGFGTISPAARVHTLNTDGSVPRGVLIQQISPDAFGAALTARKARGTAASPAAIANGDNAFVLHPQSYDGSNYVATARMFFTVDGPVTTGNVPTAIRFTTGATAEAERMRITSAGDVLIGMATGTGNLEVAGNANFGGTVTGGNIKAKYQDVAEWVPSTEAPAAGTVVVLDPLQSNHVIASSRAYDTSVAGVVSAQPGIILGDEGDSKSLVATTGRVKVKVDASRYPIAIGDLLVTSDKSGVAMKSIPIEIQGVAIHRPGTVVGKALEPLPSGQGEILVLLSLQ